MRFYRVLCFDKKGKLKEEHVHTLLRVAEEQGFKWQQKKKGNYYEVSPFEENL